MKNNFQKLNTGNIDNVDIFHIFYIFIEHMFFYGILKICTADKIHKILKLKNIMEPREMGAINMIDKISSIKENGKLIYTKEENIKWSFDIISLTEKRIKDGNILSPIKSRK